MNTIETAAKALYELWYAPLNWERNCPDDARHHFYKAVYIVGHALKAQGIETRRAETEGLGTKPESPVAEGDAP